MTCLKQHEFSRLHRLKIPYRIPGMPFPETVFAQILNGTIGFAFIRSLCGTVVLAAAANGCVRQRIIFTRKISQDQKMDQALKKQVATWLLACCALMFAMVGISGVSGLLMVEWQPLTGTFPPLAGKFAGTIAPLSTLELRRINGTF